MDRLVCSVSSLALIIVAVQVLPGTVAAPSANLIPRLPGQPKVSFSQYSGYITVDQSHGRKLFYYFVEAAKSAATAPLVLWLNGGPGCSSLGGAFSELGPFYPASKAGESLVANNYSWNQVANVIFLESPAGVGFSYSNVTADYTTGDNKTAYDSLAFLVGWLIEYPEYKSRDFYITGESYAGHYAPQLASLVLEHNKLGSSVDQIRLKGVMVGNPLFDYILDRFSAPVEYGWGHGMVSEATHEAFLQHCNFSEPDNLSEACVTSLITAGNEIGGDYLNQYDVLEDACLASGGSQALTLKAVATGSAFTVDPCIATGVQNYLNKVDVQTALHTKAHSTWSDCSNPVNYTGEDVSTVVTPVLTKLASSGLRLWIYSGDADIVVPLIGTRKIVNTIATSLKLNVISAYQQWFQGCQVGGWSISWGTLAFVTVRGAGHLVPGTEPERALQLVTSFLAGDKSPPTNSSSCPPV